MRNRLLNSISPKQQASDRFLKMQSPDRRPHLRDDYSLFFTQSLQSLSVTASLFPSSRRLASALLRPIDFSAARVVVELGVGTGAITSEILRRLRPDSVLLGVDLNPVFVKHVQRKIRDARFIPILGKAERMGSLLGRYGIGWADAVVSSLGLTGMRPTQRSTIMAQIAEHLTSNGVLTQYQYLHVSGVPDWMSTLGLRGFHERDFLLAHFRHVASERVIWNLPPARVYTCRP
jgi:phosphatidylethanolamine/phosphatidyl-N-methylethanolamine N-methyltransferase